MNNNGSYGNNNNNDVKNKSGGREEVWDQERMFSQLAKPHLA